MLEHAGYFVGAGAVTRGFVHDHDAYARIEQRPEIVEVVNHVVEIHLQYGRMRALFERMADFLEAERTAAFEQDAFVYELCAVIATQEFIRIAVERFVAAE